MCLYDTAFLDKPAHVFLIIAIESWCGYDEFRWEFLLEIVSDLDGDFLVCGLGHDVSSE